MQELLPSPKVPGVPSAVFTGTTKTRALPRSSQHSNVQKLQVYTFPPSTDRLKHILLSLPDQSLLLKASMDTLHPSHTHGFPGKASPAEHSTQLSRGRALRLQRGTDSRQGCSWDLLGLRTLLKERSLPWLQQPCKAPSLDVPNPSGV